jgi:hypothetical protein
MDWRERAAIDAIRLVHTQQRVTLFAKRIDRKLGEPEERARKGYSAASFLILMDQVALSVIEGDENRTVHALILVSNYVHDSARDALRGGIALNDWMDAELVAQYAKISKIPRGRGGLTSYTHPDEYNEAIHTIGSRVRAIENNLPRPEDERFIPLLESGLKDIDLLWTLAADIEGKLGLETARQSDQANRFVTVGNFWVALVMLALMNPLIFDGAGERTRLAELQVEALAVEASRGCESSRTAF